MKLSPDDIAEITARLDATTPLPIRSDLLFVFGSHRAEPAQLAATLYHQDKAPYIVVTGGKNRYTGQNEADSHYHILVKAGVPADNIIVENRSTNTLENVVFARPLIDKKQPLTSIQQF